jgi:hypothetical protein
MRDFKMQIFKFSKSSAGAELTFGISVRVPSQSHQESRSQYQTSGPGPSAEIKGRNHAAAAGEAS